jgi:hypothetical protein
MAIYKLNRLYTGSLPTSIQIGDELIETDEDGFIEDPELDIANILEGMPEWTRISGGPPFSNKNNVRVQARG